MVQDFLFRVWFEGQSPSTHSDLQRFDIDLVCSILLDFEISKNYFVDLILMDLHLSSLVNPVCVTQYRDHNYLTMDDL